MPLTFVEICLLLVLVSLLMWVLKPVRNLIESKYLRLFSKLFPRSPTARVYEFKAIQHDPNHSEKEDR